MQLKHLSRPCVSPQRKRWKSVRECALACCLTLFVLSNARADSQGRALPFLPRLLLKVYIPAGVTEGVETRGRNTEITSPDGTHIRFVGRKEFEVRFKNGIHIRTRTTDVTVDYHPRTNAILVKIEASQNGAGASPSIDITLSEAAARDFTWKAVLQEQKPQGERQGLRLTGHVKFFLRQQVTIEAYASQVVAEHNIMTREMTLKVTPTAWERQGNP